MDFYFDEPCEIDRDDVYAIEVVVENKESGVVSLEKKKLTYPLLESNLQKDNEEKSQTAIRSALSALIIHERNCMRRQYCIHSNYRG